MTPASCADILTLLQQHADPDHLAKLSRFGIAAHRPFGVPVRAQRHIARQVGKSLALAAELWATGRHEARIIASMIAPAAQFTPAMMDAWTQEFASWDVCDQCCANLFRHTPYGFSRIGEYAARQEEYVRRAGFALAAEYAIGDKKRDDEQFRPLFALIERHAHDPRNFVRKAVNWSLRQIGKRSMALHGEALELGLRLAASCDKTARRIGSDAARELVDPRIIARIKR